MYTRLFQNPVSNDGFTKFTPFYKIFQLSPSTSYPRGLCSIPFRQSSDTLWYSYHSDLSYHTSPLYHSIFVVRIYKLQNSLSLPPIEDLKTELFHLLILWLYLSPVRSKDSLLFKSNPVQLKLNGRTVEPPFPVIGRPTNPDISSLYSWLYF